MSELDLDAIRKAWLQVCGQCDAGLGMSCACPQEDHRPLIGRLCDKVVQLQVQLSNYAHDRDQARAERDRAHLELERINGALRHAGIEHPHGPAGVDELAAMAKGRLEELSAYKRVVNGGIPEHLMGRHDEGYAAGCAMCGRDRAEEELDQAQREAERLTAELDAAQAGSEIDLISLGHVVLGPGRGDPQEVAELLIDALHNREELDQARRQVARLTAALDSEVRLTDEATVQRDEARQEAEQLRAVVEAAQGWASAYDHGCYGLPGSVKRDTYADAIARLAAAVDALLPTPEPEQPRWYCNHCPMDPDTHEIRHQPNCPEKPAAITRKAQAAEDIVEWYAEERAREVAAEDAKQLLAQGGLLPAGQTYLAGEDRACMFGPERHVCSGCGKTGPIRHEGNKWTCEEC